MSRLARLAAQRRRTVAGLMSGTSLDGVDAVVADLDGSGRGLAMTVRGQAFVPYPDALRQALLAASRPGTSDVRTLCLLDAHLPRVYAEAVRAACADAGIAVDALDLVGSHGQTVWHAPEPEPIAGAEVAATLQIGDPATLAKLLGVPVVGGLPHGRRGPRRAGRPARPLLRLCALLLRDRDAPAAQPRRHRQRDRAARRRRR